MKRFLLFAVMLFTSLSIFAQSYIVDNEGVIREKATGNEVQFFGVNYTTPFAYAYRAHKRLGVDIKKAIDKDTYHMARLGLNAYRIHIWDIEISDGKGNLINNEHLDLFDYLIMRLKERGIKIVLTPLAMNGNGYPDENEEGLPGFSAKWPKNVALRTREAQDVHANYLKSLMNHRNPYTRTRYKDDPDIVGFEVCNEPKHSTSPEDVKGYVNRMVKAIRSTGCKKPVFYNVSESYKYAETFYESDIDGGMFQWYPTGLVANRTRHGNFLPAADHYPIPFSNIKGFEKRAKLVYEFDPADVAATYMYPAVARSFRSAGFQWITQFAYDPIEIAQTNSEYQTHFMNLAYAPNKAISLKIAGEVVRNVPRGADFGSYPQDTIFSCFRVSYKEDLSIMNSEEKYFYTNNNSEKPRNEKALREIAGCGSSPIISYDGSGAYFLDKVDEGIWRLEVMPDVQWLSDPFTDGRFDKDIATIKWRKHRMKISLSNLGNEFTASALTEGLITVEGECINVTPGVYILNRKGVSIANLDKSQKLGTICLNEFVAPTERSVNYQVVLFDWKKQYEEPLEVIRNDELTVRQFVKEQIIKEKNAIEYTNSLHIELKDVNPNLAIEVGFVTTDGFTFKKTVKAENSNIIVPFNELKLTKTVLPAPTYPPFLHHYFEPKQGEATFNPIEIESWEISSTEKVERVEFPPLGERLKAPVEVMKVWLE